jgi:hypothetical protein
MIIFKESVEHLENAVKGPWYTINRTDFKIDIDHENKIVYVTGQTSQPNDWWDNLKFCTRLFSKCEKWYSLKSVWVHKGFLNQYKSVQKFLIDLCLQHFEYAIRLSGHSLGGTWTQLFMYDILDRWPSRDVQAIFYAPANPWRRLPKPFRQKLKERTTFVYCWWDPVTWMRILRYRRYGKNILIGKPWRLWPSQHKPKQIIRAMDEKGMRTNVASKVAKQTIT